VNRSSFFPLFLQPLLAEEQIIQMDLVAVCLLLSSQRNCSLERHIFRPSPSGKLYDDDKHYASIWTYVFDHFLFKSSFPQFFKYSAWKSIQLHSRWWDCDKPQVFSTYCTIQIKKSVESKLLLALGNCLLPT